MIFKKKKDWHPSDELIRDCYYEVPADQMSRYGALTPYQRLKWLDNARRLTLLAKLNFKRAFST